MSIMRRSRGAGAGVTDPPPLKNLIKYDFFSNTCLDPLKNYKALNQANIKCWAIIGPPAKRHLGFFTDGPIMVHLVVSSPTTTTKKQRQSWTPSDKKFWI